MDFTKLIFQSGKKPKSVLRIVLSISIVLLVFWLFLVSRMDIDTRRNSKLVLTPTDSAATQSITQNLLNPSQASAQNKPAEEAQQESIPLFQHAFTTFVVLMVVMGGVWLWTRKKIPHSNTVNVVTNIAEHSLGQGAQLKIIEINNEVWVLGLTTGALTLLHRYSQDEWMANNQAVDKSGTFTFQQDSQKPDFKALYNLFGN